MLVACAVGPMLSACGGPVELDAVPGDVELGQHEAALCTDGPPDAAVNFSLGSAGFQTAKSTRTYGRVGCEKYFIVDVLGVGGHAVRPLIQWWDYTPTTQSACTNSVLRGQLWGWNGSSWVAIGGKYNTVTRYGVWTGSYCMIEDTGWGQVDTSLYSALRIAAQATVPGKLGPELRAVSAGVYDMSVPM